MLSLSQAYGARWSAAFGQRDLRYNGRLWKPIEQHHSPEDVFFGLIDPSDGSSCLLRIEAVTDLAGVSDEAIEDSMSESIADDRFQACFVDSWTSQISGLRFTFVEYAIANPNFGAQVLCHAYARGDGDVTMLSMAWPVALPRAGDGFPVKFSALLDGLSF